LRGETFVTRKITIGLSRIKLGLQKELVLGNLNAKRDWGHAKDYAEAMWKMMQLKKPDDFVIATGKQYSVRDFVNFSAKNLGIIIKWVGKGINEKGIDKKTGKTIIRVGKRYFRPTGVDTLLGDARKAKKILKWKPKITFHQMVKEMIENDYNNQKNNFIF
jgi:GDPmannose 4,6-dehydratase